MSFLTSGQRIYSPIHDHITIVAYKFNKFKKKRCWERQKTFASNLRRINFKYVVCDTLHIYRYTVGR